MKVQTSFKTVVTMLNKHGYHIHQMKAQLEKNAVKDNKMEEWHEQFKTHGTTAIQAIVHEVNQLRDRVAQLEEENKHLNECLVRPRSGD